MLWQLMWQKSRLMREPNSTEPPVGRAHLWQTGYVREVQVRRMVQLIRQSALLAPGYGAHYCEIGMKYAAHATRSRWTVARNALMSSTPVAHRATPAPPANLLRKRPPSSLRVAPRTYHPHALCAAVAIPSPRC